MRRVINIVSSLFLLAFPIILYSQSPFLSFDVIPADNRAVFIRWNTNPACDTLAFELQKTSDQKNWKVITRISPGLTHQYSYTDTSQGGILYYRARQTGSGTNVSYSQTRWVQTDKTGKFNIWPNPAKDMLHVKTPFNSGSIDILSTDGKQMSKTAITNFITDISTVRLAQGIYFIEVKYNKEYFSGRFVKE